MKRDSINYLVVGLFVLAALAALMVGLYMVTGRTGPTDPYYVNYPHVTGIKFGTPVYFEGYAVGQVEAVDPVAEGGRLRHYRVKLSITEGWPIPEDSVAQMMATGLLSALSINIRQGASGELLAPGAEIRGEAGGDLFSVMHTVATDLNELAQASLRPLLDNLNRQLQAVGGQLDRHGPALLAEGRRLMERLTASAARLEGILGEVEEGEVEGIVHNARLTSEKAVAVAGAGERFVAELNRLTSDMMRTRAEVDALLGDLRGVVNENRDELTVALRDLRRTLDVTARNADQIAYHLKGTTRNMHELSRQLRENPGMLLGGQPPREVGEERR